jgi:endonuclease III
MDFNKLLNNDAIKRVITKAGIPEDKLQAVIQQAGSTLQKYASQNPTQCKSLLSPNKNTEADNKFVQGIENDFISNLVAKVGLPEQAAKSLQGIMPQITQQLSNNLSKGDFDITKLLGSFTNQSKGGDLFASISKMASSFFSKK